MLSSFRAVIHFHMASDIVQGDKRDRHHSFELVEHDVG